MPSIARCTVCMLLVLILIACSGCAVHYFDAENNVEHIWGIGHMAMKVGEPREGLKAIGNRTDIAGISLGRLQEGSHLELGLSTRQRIEVVSADTELSVSWPEASSFYEARIGSAFPPSLGNRMITSSEESRHEMLETFTVARGAAHRRVRHRLQFNAFYDQIQPWSGL